MKIGNSSHLSTGRCIVMLGATLWCATTGAQSDNELSYSGYLELGGEYNSNLNISALETSTGESDMGLLGEAGLNVEWQPGERWTLQGGYSYSGSRYDEVDALNLDLHMLHVDISHAFDFLTVGGNHYYADAALDGEGFLELSQSSLYGGRLLGEQWYLRGAWNIVDKRFDRIIGRDADTDGFSLDIFRFFNSGRTSLSLGFDAEQEDTRTDQFDYDASTWRARFSHRMIVLERDARVRLGLQRETRDYDELTPAIGERRDDTRQAANAELELSWLDNLAVIGTIERGLYDSNLPSADYSETRITLAARMTF